MILNNPLLLVIITIMSNYSEINIFQNVTYYGNILKEIT